MRCSDRSIEELHALILDTQIISKKENLMQLESSINVTIKEQYSLLIEHKYKPKLKIKYFNETVDNFKQDLEAAIEVRKLVHKTFNADACWINKRSFSKLC